jgi:hypothetical protein
MEGWTSSRRMEEWKNGRVEEWKSGRVEEWKNGGMEEWNKLMNNSLWSKTQN